MDADTLARMNVTVEAFVKRCLASNKPPFLELSECLDELPTLPYWKRDEIEQVEETARRILNERLSSNVSGHS